MTCHFLNFSQCKKALKIPLSVLLFNEELLQDQLAEMRSKTEAVGSGRPFIKDQTFDVNFL